VNLHELGREASKAAPDQTCPSVKRDFLRAELFPPMPPVAADDGFDIVFIDGAGRGAGLHGVTMFLKGPDGNALVFQGDLLIGDDG